MQLTTEEQNIVAPFAKQLASTEKKTRDKAVRNLTAFLTSQKQLPYIELMKLWKGLFYCFWMSDKPLVQQALAEDLAAMLLKLPESTVISFIKAFWETTCREWHGIDRHRMDKYYMLLRKFVQYSFKLLAEHSWDSQMMESYLDTLSEVPLAPENPRCPDSIRYHIIDVYLEELEKVIPVESSSEVPTAELLKPFFTLLANTSNNILFNKLVENIFGRILESAVHAMAEEEDEAGDDEEQEDEMENGNKNLEIFRYDLEGIKAELFRKGGDPATRAPNRKKIYDIYRSYKDVLSDMDEADEEEEEEDEE
ncbi:uncharacterized protein VTP21DRAFT_608 [Calcarisporiella thermophila]|uniref:uncharacterized protein n=1 Tax=Calcarisporiella thermophila TaxID=911321 RepID=UPI0037448A12